MEYTINANKADGTYVPLFMKDVDVCRDRLNEGYSPIEDGWSDGFGNAVCLENMEE